MTRRRSRRVPHNARADTRIRARGDRTTEALDRFAARWKQAQSEDTHTVLAAAVDRLRAQGRLAMSHRWDWAEDYICEAILTLAGTASLLDDEMRKEAEKL